MNRTLLSQAIQLECPNHFTHPHNRWGQTYEMPFVIGPAVGAAATAISGAVAGTVAVGTAITATVSAISTIAMVAGLAMTVVGAITGNADLMKIGGYVGLAGGIGSIATSLVGTTTAAAGSIGSQAGAEGAKAGTQAGTNAAQGVGQAAIQPTVNTATNITTPATNSLTTGTQTATSGSGLLSGGIREAITPAGMEALETGGGLGSGVGQIGANTPVTQSTSFFDELMKPTSLLELGKIGAGAVGGMYQASNTDKLYDLKKNEQDFLIDKDAREYANANVQGRGMLSTRALTQEERDAAMAKKAAQSKKMAKILTAPAGS